MEADARSSCGAPADGMQNGGIFAGGANGGHCGGHQSAYYLPAAHLLNMATSAGESG